MNDEKSISDDPFFGLWKDRDDLKDGADWVRTMRKDQWISNPRPTEDARERVAELLEREKLSKLTSEEKSELDSYLQLGHLMRIARLTPAIM